MEEDGDGIEGGQSVCGGIGVAIGKEMVEWEGISADGKSD